MEDRCKHVVVQEKFGSYMDAAMDACVETLKAVGISRRWYTLFCFCCSPAAGGRHAFIHRASRPVTASAILPICFYFCTSALIGPVGMTTTADVLTPHPLSLGCIDFFGQIARQEAEAKPCHTLRQTRCQPHKGSLWGVYVNQN